MGVRKEGEDFVEEDVFESLLIDGEQVLVTESSPRRVEGKDVIGRSGDPASSLRGLSGLPVEMMLLRSPIVLEAFPEKAVAGTRRQIDFAVVDSFGYVSNETTICFIDPSKSL